MSKVKKHVLSKAEGLIPDLRFPEFVNDGEWEKKKLEELGDFLGGGTPSKSNPEYWIGEIPWISSSDICEDDIRSISITRFVNKNAINQSATKVIPKGSVLFVSRVGVGKLAINECDLCTSQDFTSFVSETVHNYFIGYYSLANKHLLQSMNQGTSIKGFSKSDLENFILPYPQKHQEQQKIASCLSSLDDLITAHSDKLKALKDHKKGLMQNLFPQEGEIVPKVRFSEFEDDGNWLPTTVEDNCLIKGRIGYRGYTKQDLVNEGEGVLVLGGKHIQNQLLNISDPTFLSWEKYYESPEIMVELNHIIFSQRGSLGDCAIIDREIGEATINPSMVLMRDINCNARFLYYVLIGDEIQREVSRNSTTAAIPMLSQKQIKEFPFLIPEPQEQQKIASCLSALDELIKAQADKIEQLQQHKKGLMQGLFPKFES